MIREILGLGPAPWIAGHRGVRGEAIENSVPSLKLASEQRADFTELDVRLTADGVLVAFHDESLDRMTGKSGAIEERAFADLPRLRGTGEDESGERIPSLAEVLSAVGTDAPLNIELKIDRADPARLVQALLDTLDSRQRLVVSTFDWSLLRRLRQSAPSMPLAPLGRETVPELVAAAIELDACAVHASRRIAGAELAELAEGAGLPVIVYTVNDADEARELFDAGIAGVFSDHPGRLRRELGL